MANVQDRGPPSTTNIVLATAIVSGLAGYYFAQARSIGLFGGQSITRTAAEADTKDSDVSDAEGSASPDEDDDVQDLGELKSFAGNTEECKLVLVVRKDLGMSPGKIGAQCGHATLACYKTLVRANPRHPVLRQWEDYGQAKVALRIDSEEDMLMLQAQAISLGLCAQVIHDAGRTQIASGSATVLGIGPAPKSKIDEVTGHLRLL
ncbi:hypothetical protein LTR56_017906 [Elasticomyces elasticus]|nr:hypothetical protein LTR22_022815 [Elasticomyces elasticus]KAK3629601.1 hypothetical protein LTR56_017906 [Elasticomyces elasticus]KAK4907581.1 hypothetical protein LTR49_023392 [Elasticomyces elasticus]KAK5766234.1 hypothetical protein LTS12_003718 [Elasticomyces elasticus]